MIDPMKHSLLHQQYDQTLRENERLRADLAAALELLHEANMDWVPHTSNLSAAIVDFLRKKETK